MQLVGLSPGVRRLAEGGAGDGKPLVLERGEDVYVRANGALVAKVHPLVGRDLEILGIQDAGGDVVPAVRIQRLVDEAVSPGGHAEDGVCAIGLGGGGAFCTMGIGIFGLGRWLDWRMGWMVPRQQVDSALLLKSCFSWSLQRAAQAANSRARRQMIANEKKKRLEFIFPPMNCGGQLQSYRGLPLYTPRQFWWDFCEFGRRLGGMEGAPGLAFEQGEGSARTKFLGVHLHIYRRCTNLPR